MTVLYGLTVDMPVSQWAMGHAMIDEPSSSALVRLDRAIRRSLGFVSARFGMIGRQFGEVGGSGCGPECQKANDQSSDTKVKGSLRPDNAISRSIRSLPLGAKIGVTVGLIGFAWLCFFAGFVRVLQRRINAAQGVGYLALGLGLLAASFLPWW
jgi:hypothetical protein